jgi:F-type H+-transporting ATPase subunit gamma
MANTRQIKQRIKATSNITKITKAMEMVSASKMRRAQAQALATRPYTIALQESLESVASVVSSDAHPLLTTHLQGVDVLIVLSTDKGLCGSLNPTLYKNMIEWYRSKSNPFVIPVGKKAVAFSQFVGLQIFAQFQNLPDKISTKDILPISTLIREKYLSGELKSVSVLYMDFISTLVQRPKIQQLLPIPKGHNVSQSEQTIVNQTPSEYLFEPSPQAILEHLLPYFVENSVYQSMLEAKASEHSARMVSMKNASENAKDLSGSLTLEFNKSRQASITNELLDITTAKLAQD